MPVSDTQLLQILRIGHDASQRGQGLSLRDAIQQSHYRELRPQFGPTDLIPIIQSHPELVLQWIMYCQDKRTTGGFALTGDSPEAVAHYIVRELDFWASLPKNEPAA